LRAHTPHGRFAPDHSRFLGRNFGGIIDLDQSGTIDFDRTWVWSCLEERAKPMISLEDCIGMCGLDADEVAAIGEHEHIPDIAAAALADYLLKQAGGPQRIRMMIVEDIHEALDAGHIRHAAELFMALRHFLKQHPEATRGLDVDSSSFQCRS
jgi:hypothetical protein